MADVILLFYFKSRQFASQIKLRATAVIPCLQVPQKKWFCTVKKKQFCTIRKKESVLLFMVLLSIPFLHCTHFILDDIVCKRREQNNFPTPELSELNSHSPLSNGIHPSMPSRCKHQNQTALFYSTLFSFTLFVIPSDKCTTGVVKLLSTTGPRAISIRKFAFLKFPPTTNAH